MIQSLGCIFLIKDIFVKKSLKNYNVTKRENFYFLINILRLIKPILHILKNHDLQ